MIEEEMRAVIAAHARECGARAEQMMVNNHLYPDEIAAWATEVERLRAVEAAARELAEAAREVAAGDYGEWDFTIYGIRGALEDYDSLVGTTS